MRIKTKLNLGVGLLFLMIIILSLVSAYSVFLIKQDTENILKSNYNTLEYSRNMILSLDEIKASPDSKIHVFKEYLEKKTQNVTEPGEKEATENLEKSFTLLEQNGANETIKAKIRQDIFAIMKLNLDAIKQKSDIAKHTAENANLWIAIVGSLCFFCAWVLA